MGLESKELDGIGLGKIVLHLLIIGILGYDWDGVHHLGFIPSSYHPKPRPTTPIDLFDISVVLHQKENFHIFERSCIFYLKGWPAIAKLKPTFTLLGRDFAVFNTFTYQNPYQEK